MSSRTNEEKDELSLEQVHLAHESWRRAFIDASDPRKPMNSEAQLQQLGQFYQDARDQWNNQERKKTEHALLELAASQKRSAWWVAVATAAMVLVMIAQVILQVRQSKAPGATNVICSWPNSKGIGK